MLCCVSGAMLPPPRLADNNTTCATCNPTMHPPFKQTRQQAPNAGEKGLHLLFVNEPRQQLVLAYALLRASEAYVEGFRRGADAAVPLRCALAAPLAKLVEDTRSAWVGLNGGAYLGTQLRAQAEEHLAALAQQPHAPRPGAAALLVRGSWLLVLF